MRTQVCATGLLSLVVAIVACAGSRPPPSPPPTELIRCGRGSGASETKIFNPEQTDSLVLSGHKLIVPAGALSEPTEITMWELPTPLIKVRLRSGDQEHFPFVKDRHAVLAVSYARCGNAKQIAEGPVSVYRLKSDESEDVEPLEAAALPSTPYPDQHEVRASLSRLSGYGLGAP